MAVATLSSAYLPANVVLSGGNLTATISGLSGVNRVAMATTVLPAGKWYWEQTATFTGSTTNYMGIAPHNWVGMIPQLNYYLGQDSVSVGLNPNGNVYINNSTSGYQGYNTGDRVSIAVDSTAGLLWYRVNGGNWNNAAIGSSNPATGIGGITIPSSLLGEAFSPYVGMAFTGDAGTINLGGSAFTYTAPTGFSAPNTWAFPSGVAGETIKLQATNPGLTYKSAATAQTGSFYGYKLWSPAAVATNISGTVKEGTTPVAKNVFLYDNATGALLGSTVSTGGNFSLPALGRSQVFAVAFDPTTFQAIVYDQLTPV